MNDCWIITSHPVAHNCVPVVRNAKKNVVKRRFRMFSEFSVALMVEPM